MRKLNTKEFIEKAQLIHNYKYDYSLVKYINTRTPIIIICKDCGEFKILPHSHIQGIGCAKCYTLNNEKFINKANKIHNNEYNYDKIDVTNNKTKIVITCKKHGDFEQQPRAHLKGQGCPKCFRERKKFTTEQFIDKSNKKHNNLYDYSLVEYENKKNKVKIICKKHGIFEQNAGHHLRGVGCPICKNSKGEKLIEEFLINNNIEYIRQKTFNECFYIALLRFDFYLPSYNICIEYNGLQHYKPIDYFGGVEKYNLNKQRFNIKKEFCAKNNIKLITIRYNENVNYKLDKYFN